MKKNLQILIILSLFLSMVKVNGQVSMGADVAPQPHSVIEVFAEYETGVFGGLRLPQLSTAERNSIADVTTLNTTSYGLMIYNTTTNCVEYWNSKKWVSLCLGRADITLEGDHCYYDTYTIPDDGVVAPICTFTPVEHPNCVTTSSAPYQVYLTMGQAYATLVVDELTSEFTITFTPNNSTNVRMAVVRVVSNCTGEYKDFPFTQAGGDCPGGISDFSVLTNSTEICGTTGAVIAWIPAPQAGVDYIWTLGGAIVHTGTYAELTRAGTYTIYTGLMGCSAPAPQNVVLIKNIGDTGGSAPEISATNDGILCSGGSVVLTATGVSSPVEWYHNGIPYPSTANPLTLTEPNIADYEGEWFAVQMDGTCGSKMSNVITLIDNTGGDPALPLPLATVNGTALTGSPTICKGGSLELEVTNAAAYPAGTIFEWYVNGTNIPGTEAVNYYDIDDEETVILWVQAKNSSMGCPNTAVSSSITVTFTAPDIAEINGGDANAAICGTTPAHLSAFDASADSYEWFFNGVKITTTDVNNPSVNSAVYNATAEGSYTVRYVDNNGCWSPISDAITVYQSAPITLNWEIEPVSPMGIGQTATYSVSASPDADDYLWTGSQPTVATVTPLSSPAYSAYVAYIGAGTTNLKIEATNDCGTVSLDKDIVVCTPATLTPATNTIYEICSMTLTANSTNNSGWENSDPSVVTISGTGANRTIKAVSPGTATITFTNVSGCTATAEITVLPFTLPVFYPNNLGATENYGTQKDLMALYASKTWVYTDNDVWGKWYQWGRYPDGYEARNSISVEWDASITYDATTGQIESGSTGYGNHVYGIAPFDWRGAMDNPPTINNCTSGFACNSLWGNGEEISTATPGSGVLYNGDYYQSTEWVHPENNPCPSGWRVPTQDEWEMLGNYNCDPTSDAGSFSISNGNGVATSTGLLTWVPVRCNSTDNKCYNDNQGWTITGTSATTDKGGYAIYYTTDWSGWYTSGTVDLLDGGAPEPYLFLPAAGGRNSGSVGYFYVGPNGFYWSSSIYGYGAHRMDFSNSNVYPNGYSYDRAHGHSVRCVAE